MYYKESKRGLVDIPETDLSDRLETDKQTDNLVLDGKTDRRTL